MKHTFHKFFAVMIILMAAMAASARDLTGYYNANDGGAYFLRQIGEKVYGFAEHSNGSYANVLYGTRNGNIVSLRWWDIPKGKAKGGGNVIFHITGANETVLTKQSSTAPFGTSSMKWGGTVVESSTKGLRSKPEAFRDAGNTLTGAWNGDDYATYYVREMPSGDVVWFAENNLWGDPGGQIQPSFANVFIGKKIGGLVTGEWVSLPKGKAVGNNTLSLKVVNQQELKINNQSEGSYVTTIQRSLPNSLRGFADLHTHPMVHLALGRKFVHGAPDVGSIIPADQDCKMNYGAETIAQALGKDNSTHGGAGAFGLDNRCGDNIRQAILDSFQEKNNALVTPDNAVGYPSFKDYPKYNDLTHQKMWVDWIRRAYNGGQRVMVALAMNNQTLATAVSGTGDAPVDDKASADLQIDEMKKFAKRHNDFMEIAYSSGDLRRIVSQNKMAIVLGIEIDNIGNFINYKHDSAKAAKTYEHNTNLKDWENEIDRLRTMGVRYVFPVHLVDNFFGSTAIYQDLFNLSNYHINHNFWEIECADAKEGITHEFKVEGFDASLAGAKAAKLGIDIFRNPKDPPVCKDGKKGHVNARGTEYIYDEFVRMLIRRGVLIDIDHMSIKTLNATISLAKTIRGGYPLVSGHTGLRADLHNENSRTPEQLAEISKLGGMFGLGSDNVSADVWTKQYLKASAQMVDLLGGKVAFGSDLNGLVKGPKPRAGENLYFNGFFKSETGDKAWDYRKEGVAHYGLLIDFMRDIKLTQGKNGVAVNDSLMRNAEVFATMWEKAEKAWHKDLYWK